MSSAAGPASWTWPLTLPLFDKKPRQRLTWSLEPLSSCWSPARSRTAAANSASRSA